MTQRSSCSCRRTNDRHGLSHGRCGTSRPECPRDLGKVPRPGAVGTSSTGYSQWVLQALIPIEHRSERRAGNTSTTTDPSSAAANGAGEPSSLLGCRPAQRCDSAIAPERTRRGCAYILELEQADWTQIGLADDRQPPAIATVWRWLGLAAAARNFRAAERHWRDIGAALARHRDWHRIGIGIGTGVH